MEQQSTQDLPIVDAELFRRFAAQKIGSEARDMEAENAQSKLALLKTQLDAQLERHFSDFLFALTIALDGEDRTPLESRKDRIREGVLDFEVRGEACTFKEDTLKAGKGRISVRYVPSTSSPFDGMPDDNQYYKCRVTHEFEGTKVSWTAEAYDCHRLYSRIRHAFWCLSDTLREEQEIVAQADQKEKQRLKIEKEIVKLETLDVPKELKKLRKQLEQL